MFRIAALNEEDSDDGSQTEHFVKEATKEAKEAEAFTLYGKALDLLRQGDSDKAEDVFQDLIQQDFLIEAYDLLEEKGQDAIHPGLQLLYSIYKNLATMATKRKDYKAALESYLEAVKIDNSEVTVWYKVGVTALVLEDFQLAMLAFEQGLDCNPKHWPCLDNVITVLYALNNYLECLYYISRAFQLDVNYSKGYALRNKIFSIQPSFKADTEEFFVDCDPEIHKKQIDPDEAKEYVDEALAMRLRNQIVCKRPEPEKLQFPPTIKHYSWKHLGEILVDLYDRANSADPPLSISLKVNVPDYSNLPQEKSADTLVMQNQDKDSEKEATTKSDTGETAMEYEVSDKTPSENRFINEDNTANTAKDSEKANNEQAIDAMEVDIKPTVDNEVENEPGRTERETVEKKEDSELNIVESTKDVSKEMHQDSQADTNVKLEASENRKSSIENGETNLENGINNPTGNILKVEILEESKDSAVAMELDNPNINTASATPFQNTAGSNITESKNADIKNIKSESLFSNSEREIRGENMTEDDEKKIADRPVSPDEDSLSIQEAMMKVHELLDSLSPEKSQYSQESVIKDMNFGKEDVKVKLPFSQDVSKAVDKDIQEYSAAITDTGKAFETAAGSFVKTTSYGFTVTDILSEETEKDSKYPDTTVHQKEITKASSVLSSNGAVNTDLPASNVEPSLKENIPGSSDTCPITLDDNTPGVTSCLIPGTPVAPSASALPLPVLSAVSSPLPANNMPGTSISSVCSSQPSTTSPCSHSQSLFSQTGSAVTSSVSSPGRLSPVAQSVSQPSTSSVSPARSVESVSEHGYSRGYQEMPSNQSTPKRTPVSMVARSPGAIVLHDSPSSASYIEVSMDLDDRSPLGRKSQKRKRPSLATEDILNYGKRRSTRVRNTGRGKKEEETVNFYDLLQTFLPSSLKNETEDENVTMDTDTSDFSEKDSVKEMSTPVKQHSTVAMVAEEWGEEKMVRAFLDQCVSNKGLLSMCRSYLNILAAHSKVKWPDGLSAVYMEVFTRVRRHLYIPSVFEFTDPPEFYQQTAQMCMMAAELQVDEWMKERLKVTGSTILSPRSQGKHVIPKEEVPKLFEQDLWYLTVLSGYSDVLGSICMDLCIRVYWMKARFHLLTNNMELAVFSFDQVQEYLEAGKEQKIEKVFLPNCTVDTIIDADTVTTQLETLKQSCSVAETEKHYEEHDYKRVVELLLQTFQPGKQQMVTTEYTERQSQHLMLQEALYKTEDYVNCLLWGEESFHECCQRYRHATKSDERSSWAKTMVKIFTYMQKVFDHNIKVRDVLPSSKIVRYSRSLIRLVDMNMSLAECITEMVIDSNIPWILLFHIIRQEEDKIDGIRMTEKEREGKEENMPSSHMLLNIAHEYLGSRSWCTKSDGSLLQFFMSVLKVEMSKEPSSRLQDEYQQAYEQCVYCLYGHPNKKTKAKHLQDHNATNIELTWQQAVDLFEYFKPKTMPEFDGYRSETISAELEVLMKRIYLLIPERSKTMGLKLEELQSYIEGSVKTVPDVTEERKVTLPVVEEIYYLLGDYYLKNKEFLKAIKFYLQDLCVNPRRLDSWAGMALARMSQLETKLTSADLKMDTPLYKKSVAALRCFKRAVEIEDTNNKLWIEYGTLAYQLHSHASRQMKWKKKKWFQMDEDTVKIAKVSKHEQLQTATECFKMAATCEGTEDEWLHNYMLGKCAEKTGKGIKEIVPYYFQSLECLHSEQAKYPKKIVYAYNTPKLAVEALEMYYRIHVVILKLLLSFGPDSEHHDYKLYVKYIVDAANTAFRKRIEKGQEHRQDNDTASSADESSCVEQPDGATKQSSDHTYFRQKSIQGGSTENVTMETSTNVRQDNLERSVEIKAGDFMPNKSVTTLELHSEEQTTKVDITMATSKDPSTPLVESSHQREVTESKDQVHSKAEKDAANMQKILKSPFSISSILGEKTETVSGTAVKVSDLQGGTDGQFVAEAEVKKELEGDSVSDVKVEDETKDCKHVSTSGDVPNKAVVQESSACEAEKVVKSILSHIEEMIDAEMKGDSTPSEDLDQKAEGTEKKVTGESMEVDQPFGDKQGVVDQQNTSVAKTSDETKVVEQMNSLLKLSAPALHKELMERCRHAFVTCLQRFPTHYKSHYRLAYIFFHSPYHKDLQKAHDILLGSPQWKDLDYMPCQGLFGERKQTKFFQGIWKIPIDEIDRAGSFPSHLNRCIELVLEVLRAEKDSQTLHQVHLQLNRQPEPGKKYLRDAEKRYYALTSHTYTLDSAEMQTEDMKTITDYDTRLKFLMVVYKIYEHGVHKLNKHVERTNKLLAEAYRVVVRKLETLPLNMLLTEAVRFCKQQLTQKTKTDKTQASKSQNSSASPVVLSSSQPPNQPSEVPAHNIQPPKLISLANIMKSQSTNYSLLKGSVSGTNALNNTVQTGDSKSDSVKEAVENSKTPSSPDIIVLSDSSVDSPLKLATDEKRKEETDMANKLVQPSGTSTGTVKIKMGLLQAAKRLKPMQAAVSGDNDSSPDEELGSAMSEDESEAPLLSGTEENSQTSSSSSSSSSSSDDDNSSSTSNEEESDDENDDGDDNDDAEGKSDASDGNKESENEVEDSDDNSNDADDSSEEDEESDGDEGESESDNDNSKSHNTSKLSQQQPTTVKRKLKVVPTTEDEEESSDNSNEIDLISSEEDIEQDDEKDKDYNASEDDVDDDDIIMISDEEYGPKGRAVLPSQPYQNIPSGTEILVKDMPDFDPSLISSLISEGPVPVGSPVPVGLPIPNKAPANSSCQSAMEVDKY